MIESRCECCGGRVLLPDPPARTKEEISAMAKQWDKDYEARRKTVLKLRDQLRKDLRNDM